MPPISRRRALQLGALGAAGVVGGGVGLVVAGAGRTPSGGGGGTAAVPGEGAGAGGEPFAQPAALRSTDGVLGLTLEAAEGAVRVAGQQSTTLHYNGSLPGPTLRLSPGDRVRVRLVNRLTAPTNLHVHGLHVSPRGNGDNPFVMVEPGSAFDYEYRLPEDHPPGVFWYHPHHHGTVDDQIFGGLYGAIVVGDPTSIGRTPVEVARERVLVVSDLSLDGSGRVVPATAMARMTGREGDLVLVNGLLRPELTARPDERERWRIVNACVARYLRLRLDGQQVRFLGLDSGRLPATDDVGEVVLAPGNRADLLVTAVAGASVLRALPFDRGGPSSGGMGAGGMGGMGSGGMGAGGMGAGGMGAGGMGAGSSSGVSTDLAVLRVTGTAVAAPTAPLPSPAARWDLPDLRTAAVSGRRLLTMAKEWRPAAAWECPSPSTAGPSIPTGWTRSSPPAASRSGPSPTPRP